MLKGMDAPFFAPISSHLRDNDVYVLSGPNATLTGGAPTTVYQNTSNDTFWSLADTMNITTPTVVQPSVFDVSVEFALSHLASVAHLLALRFAQVPHARPPDWLLGRLYEPHKYHTRGAECQSRSGIGCVVLVQSVSLSSDESNTTPTHLSDFLDRSDPGCDR